MHIDHPGFSDHRFERSFVYVFELNSYIEVDEEGNFELPPIPEGKYSFKTYVPGFKPSYRTVQFPDQSTVSIDVELQMLDIDTISIEHEVPAYLGRLRDLMPPPEATTDESVTRPIPSPLPVDEETEPTINLDKVIDSIRGFFRRKREGND